ncbi:MAG: fibronectin type III domain-containing protein [Ilumatobacteraceae bacterium]
MFRKSHLTSRRRKTFAGLVALTSLAALTACEPANEGTPLTSDGAGGVTPVQFGSAVAVSTNGLRMAVGMPTDSPDDRNAAGSVNVYSREKTDLAWTLEANIKQPSASARFGFALDFNDDGSQLAVGAPFDESRDGRAYVFTRGGGDWEDSIVVKPPVAGKTEYHGSSVALKRGVLAVGAPKATANAVVGAGVVRLYQLSGTASDITGSTLKSTLVSPRSAGITNDDFGSAIDMNYKLDIVVGEPTATDSAGTGRAHLFTKTGTWTWSYNQAIGGRVGTSNDYVTGVSARFGDSVAISDDGNTVAVGAPGLNSGKGAVAVAKKTSGSMVTSRKVDSANANVSGFGEAVALNSDGLLLLVVAPTSADKIGGYGLIRLDAEDNDPEYGASGLNKAAYGEQYFGTAVAMSGTGKIFVVGAPVASGFKGMARTFDTWSKPLSPLNARAVAGDGAAVVAWTTASDVNVELANTYTATSSPDGKTCTSSGTACIIYGLTNGTAYTFTVTATNAKGSSEASAASAAVTPKSGQVGNVAEVGGSIVGTGDVVAPVAEENVNVGNAGFGSTPGAPTGVKAVGKRRGITISWTAPSSDGGQAIQAYQVTATPGGRSCVATSETSCTIVKLGDNKAYTFSVVAVNINGAGEAGKKTTKTWTQPRVSRAKSAAAKDVARFAGLKTPNGAKYSAKIIGKKSATFCSLKAGAVIGKASGPCRVRVSVTNKGVTTSKNVTLRTVR